MSIDAESFAKAVERLQAGEPLNAIVAAADPAVQAQLRSLLLLTEHIGALALQPVPQPSPVRRDEFRTQFLNAAALRAAELQAVAPPPAPLPAEQQPSPTVWVLLAARIQALWQAFFDVPVLRLAPLAMTFILVALVSSWAGAAAEVVLPGNPIYPIKQWARDQQIQLSPLSVRDDAKKRVEDEIRRELERLAELARTNGSQMLEPITDKFVYYGASGALLKIGPLLVIPHYQREAKDLQRVAMEIVGNLTPGSMVRLTYKLLPGSPDTVQGVRIEVLDSIPPMPTPTPTATLLAAPGAGADTCIPDPPAEWISILLSPGATLRSIAAKFGVSAERIRTVNCMVTDELPPRLYLPYQGAVEGDAPLATPLPPAPVPEPLPTRQEPPTPRPTATDAAPEPTADPDATATPDGTSTPDGESTPVSSPEPTATRVYVGTPPATPTASATKDAAPTGAAPADVDATATTTPDATPTSAPTGTAPTEEPGATATDQPTGTAPTEEPAATATDQPTAAAPTEEPAATATDKPTAAAPTEEPVATATTGGENLRPAATATPRPAPTAESTPTREPDPPTREPDPPTREPDPPTREPDPPTREPDPPTREPDPPRGSRTRPRGSQTRRLKRHNRWLKRHNRWQVVQHQDGNVTQRPGFLRNPGLYDYTMLFDRTLV